MDGQVQVQALARSWAFFRRNREADMAAYRSRVLFWFANGHREGREVVTAILEGLSDRAGSRRRLAAMRATERLILAYRLDRVRP